MRSVEENRKHILKVFWSAHDLGREMVLGISWRLDSFYRRPIFRERIYSIFNVVSSLVSVAIYLVDTELSPLPYSVQAVDATLALWFCLVFITEFAQAHDRYLHVRRWMTWADLLSLVPVLRYILWTDREVRSTEKAKTIAAFRAFRVLRIHRILVFFPPGSRRRIWETCLLIFTMLFLISAFVYEVDGRAGFSEKKLTFFESFYFVVITFTTVGYGDIYPRKIHVRMVLALVIPPMIVVLPLLINRVYKELSDNPLYARRVKISASRGRWAWCWRWSNDNQDDEHQLKDDWHQDRDVWHHVVIAGNVVGRDGERVASWRLLPAMLEHCFLSEDDKLATRFLQMVVLNARDPPKAFRACVLDHPYYQTRVGWVTGSAYEPKHLIDWARAKAAIAVIVVGDANASRRDRQLEDDRTVRQAVAIKRILERECGGQYVYHEHSRKIKVVVSLFYERNFYRLEDEARTGCDVICLDEIKLALMARSIVVPAVHTLMTNLVCKRPLHRLIIDKSKVSAFGADPTRSNNSRQPTTISMAAVSQLKDSREQFKNLSVRGLINEHNAENRIDEKEEEELSTTMSPTKAKDAMSSSRRQLGSRPRMLSSASFRGSSEGGLAGSSLLGAESAHDVEALEHEMSAQSNIFEIPATENMIGVRFSDLAEAAHQAVVMVHEKLWEHGSATDALTEATANRLRNSSHQHLPDSILGALPVAVVARPHSCSGGFRRESESHHASSHSCEMEMMPMDVNIERTTKSVDGRPVVVNFPGSYELREGDAILVIARCRRDAEAVLCFIDYASLKEKSDSSKPSFAEDDTPLSISSRRLDAEARAGMASVARIGHLASLSRARYIERWITKHVCCEVPNSLEGHVVFCGGADEAQYFLQPLMFGLPTRQRGPRKRTLSSSDGGGGSVLSRPHVAILDHVHYPDMVENECDLEDGAPKVSLRYKSLLEQLIFYCPLTEGEDDSRNQRLWIVLGSALERPRRYQSSRFPCSLERVGAQRCAHFILPRAANEENAEDDVDEGLMEDDFNVKVARNLQLIIPRGAGRPAPHMLIEVLDPQRSREFLDLHLEEVVGDFNNVSNAFGADRYVSRYGHQRIEMFSDRLLQSASVVAAVDSENIIPFVQHALCAWRSDGSLPSFVLMDGHTYDSSTIAIIDIGSTFYGRDYTHYLSHVIATNKALPIALYRRSRKKPTEKQTSPRPTVRSTITKFTTKLVADDDTTEDSPTASITATTAAAASGTASTAGRTRRSSIISAFQDAFNATTSTGTPAANNDEYEPFYVYINPLPGDVIQPGDKAFVFANSKSSF